MKKLFLGATVGALAGAFGYKLYKENEEDVKEFLEDCLDSEEYYDDDEMFDCDSLDVDEYTDLSTEGMDIEELEELRDFLNNEISARHNQHTDTNYDDEYICVEANPEDSVEEEELN